MNNYFDELIISSGGNKGISIVGALNKFIKHSDLNNFKYLTGCSIGAIICFMLNIGYTIEELNDIVFHINFEIFQELKVINIIEKCGFDEGIKIADINYDKAYADILHKQIVDCESGELSDGLLMNSVYKQYHRIKYIQEHIDEDL